MKYILMLSLFAAGAAQAKVEPVDYTPVEDEAGLKCNFGKSEDPGRHSFLTWAEFYVFAKSLSSIEGRNLLVQLFGPIVRLKKDEDYDIFLRRIRRYSRAFPAKKVNFPHFDCDDVKMILNYLKYGKPWPPEAQPEVQQPPFSATSH